MISEVRSLIRLSVLVLPLCVAGCNTGEEDAPKQSDYLVTNVDIIDSYGRSTGLADQDSAVGINAAILDGEFAVSWMVSSNNRHYYSLGIGFEQNGRDRVVFTDGRCSTDCHRTCYFTTALTMFCRGDQYEADISSLINRLPQELYLTMEVCDLSFEACDMEYKMVELQ